MRRREIDARIDKQMRVEIGFVERLVIFWSNHFSMTVNKADSVRGTIGQLERDVIRKHVLGNFSDMLLGVMKHPAMIAYLDNANSIGPNSPIGLEWGVGFNENLAREVLELHTVGSGGGYTEADVTAFAKILTGWSYVRGWEADGGWNGGTPQNRGRFIFRADWHEPGPIRFMGKTYPAAGIGQAMRVLADLAQEPGDGRAHRLQAGPPLHHRRADAGDGRSAEERVPRDRRRPRRRWRWRCCACPPPGRRRCKGCARPTSARSRSTARSARATWTTSSGRFAETLLALHQMVWECPSPEGYSDDTLHWLDPDGMTIRLDTAQLSRLGLWRALHRQRGGAGEQALRQGALRRDARAHRRIGDKTSALTILFSSPEFQRR